MVKRKEKKRKEKILLIFNKIFIKSTTLATQCTECANNKYLNFSDKKCYSQGECEALSSPSFIETVNNKLLCSLC
jgi:hypothetical protein